jgi:hypothetical protein
MANLKNGSVAAYPSTSKSPLLNVFRLRWIRVSDRLTGRLIPQFREGPATYITIAPEIQLS